MHGTSAIKEIPGKKYKVHGIDIESFMTLKNNIEGDFRFL